MQHKSNCSCIIYKKTIKIVQTFFSTARIDNVHSAMPVLAGSQRSVGQGAALNSPSLLTSSPGLSSPTMATNLHDLARGWQLQQQALVRQSASATSIFYQDQAVKEKAFHCDRCDAKFSSDSGLWKHKNRVHLKKATYVCPFCGKGYFDRNRHEDHIFHVHKNIKTHQCPYCPTRFAYKTSLYPHIRDHHGRCLPADEDLLPGTDTALKTTGASIDTALQTTGASMDIALKTWVSIDTGSPSKNSCNHGQEMASPGKHALAGDVGGDCSEQMCSEQVVNQVPELESPVERPNAKKDDGDE